MTTPFRLPSFLLKIDCASCLAEKLCDKSIMMEALGFLTKAVVQYSACKMWDWSKAKINTGWNAPWKYIFLSDYRKSWVKPIPSCEMGIILKTVGLQGQQPKLILCLHKKSLFSLNMAVQISIRSASSPVHLGSFVSNLWDYSQNM